MQKFVNPIQYVDLFCDPLVGIWLLDDFLLLLAQMKSLHK